MTQASRSPLIRSACPRLAAIAFVVGSLMTIGVGGAVAQPAGSSPLPKPRVFPPGVLTTISPDTAMDETVDVHEVIELRSNAELDWAPELASKTRTLFSRAGLARFRRDVWCLEYSFKPLRMMWIDLPQADGRLKKTLVWYLVYQVRNTGQMLKPTESSVAKGEFNAAPKADLANQPRRFVPNFVLEGHELNRQQQRLYRAYLDRVIPAAVEPIRRREVPGRVLHTSVSIAETPIPVSTDRDAEGVWGVAMWQGVDPEIDFFSVYVRGLTNAYRWTDTPGAYQPGDPPGKGRNFARKTLQLCFWRPGDRFLEHESEVSFGAPLGKEFLYGVSKGQTHRWVFR